MVEISTCWVHQAIQRMGGGHPLFPPERCACHVGKLPVETAPASGRPPLGDHRNVAV
jgi:hypothetical protein